MAATMSSLEGRLIAEFENGAYKALETLKDFKFHVEKRELLPRLKMGVGGLPPPPPSSEEELLFL